MELGCEWDFRRLVLLALTKFQLRGSWNLQGPWQYAAKAALMGSALPCLFVDAAQRRQLARIGVDPPPHTHAHGPVGDCAFCGMRAAEPRPGKNVGRTHRDLRLLRISQPK